MRRVFTLAFMSTFKFKKFLNSKQKELLENYSYIFRLYHCRSIARGTTRNTKRDKNIFVGIRHFEASVFLHYSFRCLI
jgi:hypothetical protein